MRRLALVNLRQTAPLNTRSGRAASGTSTGTEAIAQHHEATALNRMLLLLLMHGMLQQMTT